MWGEGTGVWWEHVRQGSAKNALVVVATQHAAKRMTIKSSAKGESVWSTNVGQLHHVEAMSDLLLLALLPTLFFWLLVICTKTNKNQYPAICCGSPVAPGSPGVVQNTHGKKIRKVFPQYVDLGSG